jgi:membrane protease YdiL (CAAX protease family)
MERRDLDRRLFFVWTTGALAATVAATALLRGAFPWPTVVWIAVPILAVLGTRDARRVGFRAIPWRTFLVSAAAALAAELLLMALFEPWAHVYRTLVQEALATSPPDTTFAWLVRFHGLGAWAGLVLYSGLVTIFGEKLFFRGWVLQLLLRSLHVRWAIALQAALFTIPQLIAALIFPPLQAFLWVVVYSWLAIGVAGGWAAAHTGSIWPSLAAATVVNLIWTAVVV